MITNVEPIRKKLEEYERNVKLTTYDEWPFTNTESLNNSNIVVEKHHYGFKLYLIKQGLAYDFTGFYDYYSLIKINNESEIYNIEIYTKEKFFYAYLTGIILVIILNSFLFAKGSFGGLIFLFPIIVGFIVQKVRKRKFRKFIHEFLNSL